MEMDKFINRLTGIFEDTSAEIIEPGTKFQELDGWSSLTTLETIVMIRTEFSKEITGREIRACVTVRELFDYIMAK